MAGRARSPLSLFQLAGRCGEARPFRMIAALSRRAFYFLRVARYAKSAASHGGANAVEMMRMTVKNAARPPEAGSQLFTKRRPFRLLKCAHFLLNSTFLRASFISLRVLCVRRVYSGRRISLAVSRREMLTGRAFLMCVHLFIYARRAFHTGRHV